MKGNNEKLPCEKLPLFRISNFMPPPNTTLLALSVHKRTLILAVTFEWQVIELLIFMSIPYGKAFSLVPRSRSSVKVKYLVDVFFFKMAITGAV